MTALLQKNVSKKIPLRFALIVPFTTIIILDLSLIGFTAQDMAMSASSPIHDRRHNQFGVVSAGTFHSQIENFLRSIKISKSGQSFIHAGKQAGRNCTVTFGSDGTGAT